MVLLDSALLVATGPLESARIAPELEHVLARLAVLEVEHTTVALYEHHAGARLDLFVCETADAALRHLITSGRQCCGPRDQYPSASGRHQLAQVQARCER